MIFSSRTNEGRINLEIKFLNMDILSQNPSIIIEYHRLAAEKAKNKIAKEFINEIKEIIRMGGSPRGFTWSYWQRSKNKVKKNGRMGWSAFTPMNDRRVINFTEGFRTVGKRVQRYAIHPKSFKEHREVFKYPTRKTFAMYDNGEYIKSFKPMVKTNRREKTQMNIITNRHSWFRKHEYGFSYNGEVVRRPHVRPAYQFFLERKKSYFEEVSQQLKKFVDRQIKKGK